MKYLLIAVNLVAAVWMFHGNETFRHYDVGGYSDFDLLYLSNNDVDVGCSKTRIKALVETGAININTNVTLPELAGAEVKYGGKCEWSAYDLAHYICTWQNTERLLYRPSIFFFILNAVLITIFWPRKSKHSTADENNNEGTGFQPKPDDNGKPAP